MRQTIIKCDVCKKEVTEREVRNVPVLVQHYCDQTEGRNYPKEHRPIVIEKLDVCPECLDKLAVLEYGFRHVRQFRR